MDASTFVADCGGDARSTNEGIAVVGLAGRFPGARDVATFWANLCAGVESITTLDEADLDDAFDAATRKSSAYVKARGLLADVDRFDAAFFGINPREAELIDPQHRILLETAWEALEDAGLDPAATAARIGVIAGCSLGTYLLRHVMRDRETIEGFVSDYQVGSFPTLVGNGNDFLATRIAYKLDLRGPAMTVQSACSTGLLAIAQAVGLLRARQADVMLAGAASVTFPQQRGYLHQSGGMVSADGHCRTFDAAASGTVFGDGAGIVVLKRLADARAAGDRVYAVLRGVGISNDGAAKVGYSAPSVAGQAAAITAAYRDAGFDPGAIDYIECHGTATPLGDPIEIAGLAQAFAGSTGARCAIGSVKPNVGHLDVAAGMAGFIKMVLAVNNGMLPPTINFTAPNPQIDFAATPFDVRTELGPWPARAERRRGAVSAFGVGGTNVHVVIEDEPEPKRELAAPQPEIIVVSGRTPAALSRNATRLSAHLGAIAAEVEIGDVAATLQSRRAFGYRHAVSAATMAEAAAALTSLASGRVAERKASAGVDVAFLFPGQGSQFVGMGRELYAARPVFRNALDRCAEIARPYLGSDLRDALYPARPDDAASRALTATELAQPAIFAISYALAELWRSLGITPLAAAGHSVGEFVAATLAGVFSLEDAVHVVVERGRLMAALAPGAMLAVRLGENELASILPSELSIAALNSPVQSVVAGPHEAIAAFEARLAEDATPARRVSTSHAFHSSMMEPIREPLAALVGSLALRAPDTPYVSTVTGTWIEADEALSPSYWAEHALRPVRFADALATLVESGIGAFLEVGPGTALSTNARQGAPREAGRTVATSLGAVERPGGEVGGLLDAVGVLWTCGATPNWAALREGRPARHVSLPTYSFEPTRHWIDAPAPVSQPLTLMGASAQEIMNVQVAPPDKAFANDGTLAMLERDLAALLEELSGERVGESEFGVSFLELGFDSLFLGRYVSAVQSRFGVAVTFRQLLADLPSVAALARHVLAVGPPRETTLPQLRDVPVPARVVFDAVSSSSDVTAVSDGGVSSSLYESVVREQLRVMQALMRDQLALLGSGTLPVAAPLVSATPPPVTSAVEVPTTPATVDVGKTEEPSRFDAFRIRGAESADLTPAQRKHVDELVARLTKRTAKSKTYTQQYRSVLADPRVAAGFRIEWKEMVYPIVCERASGSRLWDLDGNEYIDILNGFGQTAFGHAPDFVVASVAQQLDRGFAIGPQADLAGDVAKRFCAMTGNERMTFCNTGSEAVMAAIRVARTVTGRDRIVVFNGAYHGQFDEVLVKGARSSSRSIPVAPGIPNGSVANVTVLQYATPETLAWVREHAAEIAAVVVEPVQSRHPSLQPKEFLQDIRAITEMSETALVFDEVVTGFRVHPGGIQALFDVRADLVTYGKVVGGGMPIGVLAGKARFMDALDGGMWQYGDDSAPEVPPTFFAGTFVRHPLTVAAVDAVLRHLETHGPALQAALTELTAGLVSRLNEDLAARGLVSRIETFGSMFYVNFALEERFAGLLYYHLRERGIYIQEGFPCFLTSAHVQSDVDAVVRAFASSLDELQRVGIFTPSAEAPSVRALPPEPRDVALTAEQTEVWLAAQMGDAASCAFNESVTVRISGELDEGAFVGAWDVLIARHDALRSTFSPSGETMHVVPQLVVPIEIVDASEKSSVEAAEELRGIVERETTMPFDVVAGPVLRGTLLKISSVDRAFVFTAHHLVCDGWSMNTILEELSKLYDLQNGKNAVVLDSPLSFCKYAEDRAREGNYPHAATTEAYWLEQFALEPLPLELPLDRPRPAQKSYKGGSVSTEIDAADYAAIKKAGAKIGCTAFVTLLTAFQVLLGRLGRANDIVVCVPAAGQSLLDGKALVGHCVNFLPVRAKWEDTASLASVMAQVRDRVLGAFEHQEYTLGSLVRAKKFSRDRNRLPLSEVQFNLERIVDDLAFGRSVGRVVSNAKAFVNFDVFLNVIESAAGARVECEYNAALFEPSTVQNWLRSYRNLLDMIVRSPEARVEEVGTAVDPRKSEASTLSIVSGAKRSYPDGTIHSLIEANAKRTPDATAIICGKERLDYAEVDRRANRLARYLRTKVSVEGRVVGVAVSRSSDMVVALLATLKAGFAYVPLDPAHPAARAKIMLEEAGAAALIVDGEVATAFAPPDLAIVNVAAERDAIAAESDAPTGVIVDATAPAYVIFTSGTTGVPKGVEIAHRSLVNMVTTMAEEPGFTASDVLVAVTTIAFDMSAFEIYTTLSSGGTLVIATSEDVIDGYRLCALIEETRATMLQSTPATWRLLAEANFHAKAGFCMLSGGEALSQALADRLLDGEGELWNVYGPTETTVYATRTRIFRGEPITIGRPLANTFAYILDDLGHPVARGALGELYIGGDALALGYINSPELSARRFPSDPFNGGRMYRTGDSARMLPDGTIEAFGRLDDQVKLRGYRIELSEIESALMRLGNFSATTVALREDRGRAQLVAYLVPRGSMDVETGEIAERLRQQFPDYMVPTAWVTLDALPLSANGKVDRRALPAPTFTPPCATVTPLVTPIEKQLGSLWADVLGRSEIGRDEDIFSLGADSIQIFQIVARANREGIALLARDIMKKRTIAKIAAGLGAQESTAGRRLTRTPVARPNGPSTADRSAAATL